MAHRCDGQCWAYMIRYGLDENARYCDPFKAEQAAYDEQEGF